MVFWNNGSFGRMIFDSSYRIPAYPLTMRNSFLPLVFPLLQPLPVFDGAN